MVYLFSCKVFFDLVGMIEVKIIPTRSKKTLQEIKILYKSSP
jgi:hypothetical protein